MYGSIYIVMFHFRNIGHVFFRYSKANCSPLWCVMSISSSNDIFLQIGTNFTSALKLNTQMVFTCPRLTIQIPEQSVKYVQNQQ